MHVAVIGAGAAGLCAARHITTTNCGLTCVVFEQTDRVGGTWVYTEETGKDKYGIPICSAMYKNLRTNLAKENMEFLGFPLINSNSFLTAAEILKYLEDYTDFFYLKNYIKFRHHVKNVVPKDNKWQITAVDLLENRETLEEFDAVIVCSGHFSVPHINFPDTSDFKGEVKHSHTYRIPDPFTNKTVLVCGGGPSGIDISYDLANFASKIYLSQRSSLKPDAFPENVEQVPIVKAVKNDYVIFENGTLSGHIDTILICTGYKYTFPFLAPECGITVVDDKYVRPLYKSIININYPTMAFIGLLFRTFLLPLFDYQVSFFLKTLTGEVELISKEDMFAELEQDVLEKQKKCIPVRKYHDISNEKELYVKCLGELAHMEPLKPVFYNIYDTTGYIRSNYLPNYRDAVFHVVNDNDFTMSGLVIDDLKKETEPNSQLDI